MPASGVRPAGPKPDPDRFGDDVILTVPGHGGAVTFERNQRVHGDREGGQRTIVRFGISNWTDVEGERAEVLRYWSVDGDDPR